MNRFGGAIRLSVYEKKKKNFLQKKKVQSQKQKSRPFRMTHSNQRLYKKWNKTRFPIEELGGEDKALSPFATCRGQRVTLSSNEFNIFYFFSSSILRIYIQIMFIGLAAFRLANAITLMLLLWHQPTCKKKRQ